METENLELIIKLAVSLFAGVGIRSIVVAYLRRNEKRQLRISTGDSECVLTGHTAEEEALIIRQLSEVRVPGKTPMKRLLTNQPTLPGF